jgi:hypothetical protein
VSELGEQRRNVRFGSANVDAHLGCGGEPNASSSAQSNEYFAET